MKTKKLKHITANNKEAIMFRIIICGVDIKYETIISETDLREIFRLLETSKIYRLESLVRIYNGVLGEELLEILKDEVRDNFIQG